MPEQTKIEETVENLKDYVQTRYELITLQASDKISYAGSEILSGLLVALIYIFAFLLLSFAAAFYISSLTENGTYSGFLIVGGIYLVIGIIFMAFRKKLIAKPFRNKIIKEIFKD